MSEWGVTMKVLGRTPATNEEGTQSRKGRSGKDCNVPPSIDGEGIALTGKRSTVGKKNELQVNLVGSSWEKGGKED